MDWLRRIFGEEKTLFDPPRQKTKAEGYCYITAFSFMSVLRIQYPCGFHPVF